MSEHDQTPMPDSIADVVDDPASPGGELDQLPYPDVEGLEPDDETEDEGVDQ